MELARVLLKLQGIIIIIIIIIFIYCNWVVTRWQWLFYIYTKHEIGYCEDGVKEERRKRMRRRGNEKLQ